MHLEIIVNRDIDKLFIWKKRVNNNSYQTMKNFLSALLSFSGQRIKEVFFERIDLSNIIKGEKVNLFELINNDTQKTIIADLIIKNGGGLYDILAEEVRNGKCEIEISLSKKEDIIHNNTIQNIKKH